MMYRTVETAQGRGIVVLSDGTECPAQCRLTVTEELVSGRYPGLERIHGYLILRGEYAAKAFDDRGQAVLVLEDRRRTRILVSRVVFLDSRDDDDEHEVPFTGKGKLE